MTLKEVKKKINSVKDVDELANIINSLANTCCKKCSDEDGYEDSCSSHNGICLVGLKKIIN